MLMNWTQGTTTKRREKNGNELIRIEWTAWNKRGTGIRHKLDIPTYIAEQLAKQIKTTIKPDIDS